MMNFFIGLIPLVEVSVRFPAPVRSGSRHARPVVARGGDPVRSIRYDKNEGPVGSLALESRASSHLLAAARVRASPLAGRSSIGFAPVCGAIPEPPIELAFGEVAEDHERPAELTFVRGAAIGRAGS